ncbi:hypothetical protein BD626DRAFT_571405 [Schizophyllum amplum]|uniref:Uncharacterized protein n=1 Tax=Schizophyllum amplum TaxID=97359 RepID=A0A550C7B4_9AGAR|nr:hypothetical protein BD626DRAFT_571405 [Auriculariopsis ampla]
MSSPTPFPPPSSSPPPSSPTWVQPSSPPPGMTDLTPTGLSPMLYSRTKLSAALQDLESEELCFSASLMSLMLSTGFGRGVSWSTKYTADVLRTATDLRVQKYIELHLPKRTTCPPWAFARQCRAQIAVYSKLGSAQDLSRWRREARKRQRERTMSDRVATVVLHVGADVGPATSLTLQVDVFDNLVVLGNYAHALISKGVDISATSAFYCLPNGALVRVDWLDTLPVPESRAPIELFVHRRRWAHAPRHVIMREYTPTCVYVWMDNLHRTRQFKAWVPVLVGGWLLLDALDRIPGLQGFTVPDGGVLLCTCFENPAAYVETSLDEPVAVPESGDLHIRYGVVCRRCYYRAGKISVWFGKSHTCGLAIPLE